MIKKIKYAYDTRIIMLFSKSSTLTSNGVIFRPAIHYDELNRPNCLLLYSILQS